MTAALIDTLVEAYNRHDADAFAAHFVDDAVVFEHPGVVAQTSRAAIAAFYADLFARFPANRTTVLHRITLGATVIDHERVERGDGSVFEVAAIYGFAHGRIARLDFIRGDARAKQAA